LEVAYSFDKALEYAEDEMMRAILLESFICKSIGDIQEHPLGVYLGKELLYFNIT
jgi:hypothetical protein